MGDRDSPVGTIESGAPALHALVVDDDPINGKLLTYLLEDRNLIVDRTESGSQAIRMIADRAYDLVFLDLHMPDTDGWGVLKALKQRQHEEQRPYPPLIATTADIQADSRERLLRQGMDDYLAKPVDHTALDQIIARWTQTGP